ncbi:hypothetical protein K5549_012021 [Capra hircus]|nr:hypothetical protein K5549_012021 [Capra hircus]
MMRTPRPRQTQYVTQTTDDIYFITRKHTHPLQALQSTFLLSCSLVVLPLYRSSKDTLGCIMSSPLLLPFRLLL